MCSGRLLSPSGPICDRGRVDVGGGLNKLEIYRKLGVREVWFWRRGRLTVHRLHDDAYEDVSASAVLPGIDLAELASYLDRPTASQAIREYRSALQRT